MAYLNGRLPSAVLGPIPGGRLRRDAARAFRAMNAESVTRFGVTLHPTGGMSSYRTYAQQVYLWNLYKSGHGNLAAVPGTSNHGLGLAVDLATPQMRQIVDQIGSKYGFAKRWSDAPSEWWHIKWRSGVWNGTSPYGNPVLKRGQTSRSVVRLKKLMYNRGIRKFGSRYNPYFNKATEDAIKRFQKKHGFHADGIVGAKTWEALHH